MNQPSELSYRENETLKLISKYISEHNGKPPYRNNRWFEHQPGYTWTSNDITNIKAALRDKGYIDEYTRLTDKGKRYIHWHFGDFAVQASEIRVQGRVYASPTDETVAATIENLDNPSENVLTIPNVSRHSNSFALQVDGESMVAMGIFPGDYVIVEKQDSLWCPEAQDVIVTDYLPHDPNRRYDESVPSQNEYVGPVLKIYKPRIGRPRHELGWGKRSGQNPYLIQADDIRPIGKVVGVYRDYRSPMAKGFSLY